MAYRNNSSQDDSFDHEDVLEQSRKMAQRLGIKDDSWFGINFDRQTRDVVNPLWLSGVSAASAKWSGSIEQFLGKGLGTLSQKGLLPTNETVLKVPLIRKATQNPKFLASAAFALLAASPVLPALLSPLNQWRKERAQLANTCAPIFKDMAEDGLAASLSGTGIQDNEVIYAQRRRLNTTLSHFSVNNILSLASSQVSTLIHTVTGKKPASNHGHRNADASGGGFIHTLPAAVDLLVGKYKESRSNEFIANQNTCSAFTLIETLNDQIKKHAQQGGDISHADLAFPKVMGNRSTNLPNYIATIIKAHSADMARLHPQDFSDLRPALNSQLTAVSKQLANAVASGDLAPLALIRLIGEGHIIKQQGRSLVTPEDISALVGKHAGTAMNQAEIDPADYLKMAAFKDKELKETLNNLEGVERNLFASFFPNSVLKKAGVSDADIKTIREETAPVYERNLSVMLAGICAQKDEDLKKAGMADGEIKTLRQAASTLAQRGEEAVHTMRANATNATGIELPIVNAAVPMICNGTHLGTIMQAGKEALAAQDTSASEQHSHAERTRSRKSGSHHEEGAGHNAKRRRTHSEHAEHDASIGRF